jgi:RND superfamily putative drug exporter
LFLLFVATGSILLPLKALVMILLSLTAACGLVVLVFQDGRFEALLDYHGVGALALTLPYLLVASTFGILTDYSIFLLTRIKEGWDAGLSNREAIAHGLERTGRIVTAAALLFCVAVGVLITANLVFVKEVGFGIAIAVAIDATIVRAFLVPSLMALFGRWNWWLPELPRRRWRRRASIQDLS